MDLPGDDAGPSLDPPNAKTVPVKTTKKRARLKENSNDRGKDVAVALPSDDEGLPNLEASSSKGTSSRTDTTPVGMSPEVVSCEHPGLKDAAASILSQVDMPYEDLRDLIATAEPSPLKCTLWEIFSAPRVGPSLRAMGGTSRRSYDLKHFWDLGEESYQRTLVQDVAILQPVFLMMSPPCTWVCQLIRSNWTRIAPQKRLLNLAQACGYIDFCMWLAGMQMARGDFFAMEHPAQSLAWTRDSVPE